MVPELGPGTMIVLDNQDSHKGERVRKMLKKAGMRLFFLPPHSPRLNPIEEMFSKLKRLLGTVNARIVDATWKALGKLFDRFSATS
jgi:transposase